MAGIDSRRFDVPDETRPFESNGPSIPPGHDAEAVGKELQVERRFRPGVAGRTARALNHLGGERLFAWMLRSALRAVEQHCTDTPAIARSGARLR